jgi:hypothetical protein
MNRSRKQGWNGYIESCDSFIRTFEELSALKMIPPFKRPEKIKVKHHGY